MLGKIQSGINSLGITQSEQPQVEKAPVSSEQVQTQSTSSTVQESKLAYARMKESSFTGSMQRAMLDAALIVVPGKAEETPAPVGAKAPDIGSAEGVSRELKLNDTGQEVSHLQSWLNDWRKANNLPEIQVTGVFTQETEQAVKDLQRATSLKDDGVFNENTRKRLFLEDSIRKLDPEVKLRINNAYSALQNDPAGRDNLLNLVENREFHHLISPDAQHAAINGLMQNPGNQNTLDAMKEMFVHAAILEKDKNFQKLPDEIKRQTMDTMFYKAANGSLESTERFNLVAEFASDPNFGNRTMGEQKRLLETIAAHKDNFTAPSIQSLLDSESFKNLTPEMQLQVIDIAHNNTIYANDTGEWPEEHDVYKLLRLINDKSFIAASEDEKRGLLEERRKRIAIG